MAGEKEFAQNICIPGAERLTAWQCLLQLCVRAPVTQQSASWVQTSEKLSVRREDPSLLCAVSLSSIKNSVSPGNFHGCSGSV